MCPPFSLTQKSPKPLSPWVSTSFLFLHYLPNFFLQCSFPTPVTFQPHWVRHLPLQLYLRQQIHQKNSAGIYLASKWFAPCPLLQPKSYRWVSLRTKLGWFSSFIPQTESCTEFPGLSCSGLPSWHARSLPASSSGCHSSFKSHLGDAPTDHSGFADYSLTHLWWSLFLSFPWHLIWSFLFY